MNYYTIQELKECLIHEYERGAINEQTLDERMVQAGYMVEDLLKDFQHQEIPENHSLIYVGNGCWKHENGGYISGVIDLRFNDPSPWRYEASIWIPELGIEKPEGVFARFIDAHNWLNQLA